MIIISSSLPKSGSTFICNLEIELLKISDIEQGRDNAQQKLKTHFGSRYFEWIGPVTLLRLLHLHKKHGSFVIKTHSGPTWALRFLINKNIAKATYSIRDPRDIILSTIDHGIKSRKGTWKPHPYFEKFTDVESALPMVKRILKNYYRWKKYGKVHFIRYEDFMQDKNSEIKHLVNHLDLKIEEEKVTRLIARREKNESASYNFNKGTIFRYKNEMNDPDLKRCELFFQDFLQECKYDLESTLKS